MIKKRQLTLILLTLACSTLASSATVQPENTAASLGDWRNLENAAPFPQEGYVEQPYIVVTRDGNWLCVLTTGPGRESQPGQHVVATISTDKGKTWSAPIDIEPASDTMSSWGVPLITPSGRVYCFYNWDRIDTGKDTFTEGRSYVYRYSDDNGKTWSAERIRLPLPVAAVDRDNATKGKVQEFWGVDKPDIVGNSVVFAFTRYNTHKRAEEGWLYRSDNILSEPDADKINWQLYPEAERGIRADVFEPAQQEFNIAPLTNGDLACMYRTNTGWLATAYSRDGGRSWTTPETPQYAIGGKMKNPVGFPPIWRLPNGQFLLWYHNNSFLTRGSKVPVGSRNLAWLAAGTEKDGQIVWSQPELVSYHSRNNRSRGPSYSDLTIDGNDYYISCSVKEYARIFQVDTVLIEGLLQQDTNRSVARDGLVLEADATALDAETLPLPPLPDLAAGGGFTLEMDILLEDLSPGQIVLDTRDADGAGFAVTTTAEGTLRLDISDGTTTAFWDTDPGTIAAGQPARVVFIVDGGPKLITTVVDGRLADGGESRPFGWGRFLPRQDRLGMDRKTIGPDIGSINGSGIIKLAPSLQGDLIHLRIYDRYLRTSEAVGNYKASH